MTGDNSTQAPMTRVPGMEVNHLQQRVGGAEPQSVARIDRPLKRSTAQILRQIEHRSGGCCHWDVVVDGELLVAQDPGPMHSNPSSPLAPISSSESDVDRPGRRTLPHEP